jgi:RNA polymerase sigma-70 factor (ECF subfamily)
MDEAGPRRPPPPGDAPGVADPAEATMELVQRARAGDAAAREELFTRYLPRVRKWAHRRLPDAARNAHETQDLVQETLARVFQRIETFEPHHPGAFRDYVWTTLLNCIRDIARKYQRRGPSDPLDSELPGCSPTPLEETIGHEVIERYETALDRLRPEDREAIVARIEIGLPYADVAAALGKPSAAAAHMAVSRALVRLAEEMAHARRTH